jgi:uncharacterized RDD family membrane protein YckC
LIRADEYIDSVLAYVPPGPQRERIELDLRANLAAHMGHGQINTAFEKYGEPRAVAESYLATVPMEPGSIFRRIVAAMIDIPSVIVSGFALFYTAWKVFGTTDQSFIGATMTGNPVAMVLGVATLVVMSPLYYVVAESTTGQTVGKAFLGLRVVRESGAKISVGQALVRQIPLIFSFYVLDAAFALFTEKKQRAFELISKTRVVKA